ncbi:MAG: vWA domain-containing protein [Dehalococcoidia bacterium]
MFQTLKYRLLHDHERGQALALFALGVMAFFGFAAMSIDVGRLLWARNNIQAAVDGAALAAAQSMQGGQTQATAKANEYWNYNNGFIVSQGQNVSLNVTFPPGNLAVKLQGNADIPTWFARIFGIDHWHVSASGTAASQVLDISLVLDTSGSMCFSSNPPADGQSTIRVMGPGHGSVAGGFARPTVAAAIPATGPNTGVVISLNDVRIFDQTNFTNNRSNFGNWWPTSGSPAPRYWSYDPAGALRAGIIMIDDELMRITNLNAAANTLTVSRAQQNMDSSLYTVQAAHAVGAKVSFFINGSATETYCQKAAAFVTSPTQNGPHQPFDSMISNAHYFTSLFNGSYDKIGLVSYSTAATNQNGLTGTFATIASKLDGGGGANAFLFPDGGTNIAHGIAVGRQVLDGPGKRSNAVRVLVILTDGVPNQYCSNNAAYTTAGTACTVASATTPGSCPASSTGITHAVNQAAAAKAADITVYAIGLGAGVLDCILQQIADAGGGTYYKAPTPAQLDDAFAAIAAKTQIALTE